MADEEVKRQRRERLRQKAEEAKRKKESFSSTTTTTTTTTTDTDTTTIDTTTPTTITTTSTNGVNVLPLKREKIIGNFNLKNIVQVKSTRNRTFFNSNEQGQIDDEEESHLQSRSKLPLFSLDTSPPPPSSSSSLTNINTTSNSTSDSTNVVVGNNIDGDPLDSYMQNIAQEMNELEKMEREGTKSMVKRINGGGIHHQQQSYASDSDNDEEEYARLEKEEENLYEAALKKAKKNELALVDHDSISYEFFRKDFYVEAPEISRQTVEEVKNHRMELDNIKIRGVRCPNPIKRWTQCGLPLQCLHIIKEQGFENPTPIQAQGIPAVMSGRDVIGIAKTGSGKTMAYVLPLFRHIKDQRPLEAQDGPIAIIMIPTRELAIQIHAECKKIARLMGMNVACAYGGAPIKDQIAELKRGAEILVCTPGRLIDLLCANHGRVTNLKRITYLVLDECDRLFDFGFEQQIMRIIANIRPDSQRLLFSATFPKPVEALARKILKEPLEITVGTKSTVSNDVYQYVEVMEEDIKFVRLLEILGKWYKEDADQRLLIFVDRQEAADELLRELFRRGYRCSSLHGGKDQMDRDSTLFDFKNGDCQILIATSVAARGLDVPQLNIVINFDVPNHKEDYVHRVGRTGRAGRKGRSFTFITPEQERFAPAIYHAMQASNAQIPESLKKLYSTFMEKVERGDATLPSTGFGGKGLERIEKEREAQRKSQKRSYNELEGISDDSDTEDAKPAEKSADAAVPAKTSETNIPSASQSTSLKPETAAAFTKAQEIAARINLAAGMSGRNTNDILADLNARTGGMGGALHSAEVEINDYPVTARSRVTSVEFKSQIVELFKCSITVRGTYIPSGKAPKGEERKLFVIMEGANRNLVEKAKAEVKRALGESSLLLG